MEQKAKFIIIGLIGVLIVCGVFFAQTFTSRQQLLREKQDLVKENTALNNKLEQLNSAIRSKQKEFELVKNEISQTKLEYQDLQGRYDLLKTSRDELMEKFKSRPAPEPVVEALPSTPDAYWANILKAKKDLEIQLSGLREELSSAQLSIDQLRREKGALELDVTNLQREKTDLERQLDYNKKLMDSIAQEVVRERNDKIQIEESSKIIKKENAALTRQINTLNSRNKEMLEKLTEYEKDRAELESRVSQAAKDAESQGLGQEKGSPDKGGPLELPPILVRPSTVPPAGAQAQPSGPVSKILTVDRDNNFVVIDIGEESGLKTADNLSVYRDGSKIANIEVIKVSKSVAACDIKKESLPIKIGDIVR